MPKRLVLTEIALVFAVFFVQGAVPVPDVNEPYYLGKAIHYRNPDWVRGDFFLESKDTHQVFYFTFGWLALWLPPTALAWTGRVLTWGLLAWAWRRLSFAVVPRPWCCVLSAALLVCLVERFHMAGEWVVGGVEAKGFAFVLVFLGLEALVRGRWNRVWLLLGAAAALHVLVGGWSVVAAGMAWVLSGKERPALRLMWPAVLGGFLLSLPGLVPALALNWGTDTETVRHAHRIYVYGRLAHHLAPWILPDFQQYLPRFALLVLFWVVLCWKTPVIPSGGHGTCLPDGRASRRLRGFVAGAVAIALAGGLIGLVGYYDQDLAAGLLRFYWFRLADVAVPLGVVLGLASLIVGGLRWQPALGKRWLVIAIAVASVHVGVHAATRPFPTPPPADLRVDYVAWRRACDWVARSGKIPPDARFITPRMSQTFKWYAGRGEVANRKEIPQDAKAIVAWWRRLEDLYATGAPLPAEHWHVSLAQLGARRLKQLGKQYEADYVITVARPRLPLEIVYPENGRIEKGRDKMYVIYRLGEGSPAVGPVPAP